eukprot:15366653-Ditylum_brightwellii.AAC.1
MANTELSVEEFFKGEYKLIQDKVDYCLFLEHETKRRETIQTALRAFTIEKYTTICKAIVQGMWLNKLSSSFMEQHTLEYSGEGKLDCAANYAAYTKSTAMKNEMMTL